MIGLKPYLESNLSARNKKKINLFSVIGYSLYFWTIVLFSFLSIHLSIKVLSCKKFILFDNFYVKITLFTVYQAVLSSLLCLLIGLIFVTTLQRFQRKKINRYLQNIINIPFFMPSIVGCLSLILIFGQNGLLSQIFSVFDFHYQTFIYGLNGILLCNIFYYVPFVLRAYARILSFVPSENYKNAQLLGIYGWRCFRIILYPLISSENRKIFFQIVSYCFRSFTTVLIFGGTPSNTTIEVAIFQGLNYDNNYDIVLQLSIVHLVLNTLMFSLTQFKKDQTLRHSNEEKPMIKDRWYLLDLIFIVFVLFLFALPLGCLFLKGVLSIFSFSIFFGEDLFLEEIFKSLYTALCMGAIVSIITLLMGFLLVSASYKIGKKLKKTNNGLQINFLVNYIPDIASNISLIFPPVIIGLFIEPFILKSSNYSFFTSLIVVCSLNGLYALPVVYRTLSFPCKAVKDLYNELCELQDIKGFQRFKIIDFPLLIKPISYAIATCFVFSLGDSRFTLFFSNGEFSTITLLLYDKMRNHQFGHASFIATLLILLGWVVFSLTNYILKRFEPYNFDQC